MSGPEGRTRTSPGNDAIHVEDRGLGEGIAKRATVTSKSGIVNLELHRDGSLAINVSNDSGIGDKVILGDIESAKAALDLLKPKGTTKTKPRR